MTPDTLVVVNPASAGGRTGRHWPTVRRALEEAGVDFDHRLTGEPGEATTLARTALRQGTRRVVAVGGDGTLNEVLNGFFDEAGEAPIAPGAVLGLVPSGTGGDFRRSVGIPHDIRAAAALLARGDRRFVDVGRIEYLDAAGAATRVHHFLNIADCGVGGEVALRANRSRKLMGGRATFAWASVRALVAFGCRPARVDVDGTVLTGRMQSIVVANGRYFGGGMLVAPEADVSDGLLDVVVLGDISRRQAIAGLRRIYRGEHIGQPGVSALRGHRVEITPVDGSRLLFDVEGEQVGAAPAVLTVLPGAVTLCAPVHRTA